jgi:hypothetical protein
MRLFALSVLLLITAACATPEPLPDGAPRYSFRRLPDAQPTLINPAVTLVASYEVTPTRGNVLGSVSDWQLTPQPDGSLKVEAAADWGAGLVYALKGTAETGFADTPVDIHLFAEADGSRQETKGGADAEDMAFDPVTGDTYVSFENVQRIVRYTKDKGFDQPGEMLPLKGLPPFPGNEGMEGLAFVRDDAGKPTLLIGVESGGFWACEADGDYRCRSINGPRVPGLLYKMVSLATLDPEQKGATRDILGLYRYYDPLTGLAGQLNHLVWDGRSLTLAEPLFRMVPPVAVDNYESVSPIKTANGYRLYLTADVLKKGQRPHMLVLDWKRK